jgi:hypothetical protein
MCDFIKYFDGFLTNEWIENFISTYSYVIAFFTGMVKYLAVIDEGNPTNRVWDYIKKLVQK